MHFSRAARQSINPPRLRAEGCRCRLYLCLMFLEWRVDLLLLFVLLVTPSACSARHATIYNGRLFSRDVTHAIRNSGSVGWLPDGRTDGWMGSSERARNQPAVKSATRFYLSLCFRARFLILDADRRSCKCVKCHWLS